MPGASLNITLPSSGDPWATWSAAVSTALATIISDLEAPVLFSELSANQNLAISNRAVTNAKYFGCYAGNSTAIPTNSIGVKDGDWFVTDGNGNEIQMTSGGALNIAATGGFTGDYATSGAAAQYTDASLLYEMLDSAAAPAAVKMGSLLLRGSGADATVTWAGSSDMDVILPSTNPAAVALVTIDSTGQLAHDASVTADVTLDSADLILSGTARVQHPDRTVGIAAAARYVATVGTAVEYDYGALQVTGSHTFWFPVPVQTNQRLKSVTVYANKNSTDSLGLTVYKGVGTSTAPTSVATGSTTSSGNVSVTAALGSPAARVAGEHYVVRAVITTAVLNTYYEVEYTYDEVA